MTVKNSSSARVSCIAGVKTRRTLTNMAIEHRSQAKAQSCGGRSYIRRFAPIAVVLLAMVAVFATGVHRQLSLETLVRHRMAIDAFMSHHMVAALGSFIASFNVVVALSIPGSLFLTLSGGIIVGQLSCGRAIITGYYT